MPGARHCAVLINSRRARLFQPSERSTAFSQEAISRSRWLLGHFRNPTPINPPVRRNVLGAAPEAHSEPRRIGGPQRGCFDVCWSRDWSAKNVGLELHQEIIRRHAAVNPKFHDRVPASSAMAARTSRV